MYQILEGLRNCLTNFSRVENWFTGADFDLLTIFTHKIQRTKFKFCKHSVTEYVLSCNQNVRIWISYCSSGHIARGTKYFFKDLLTPL